MRRVLLAVVLFIAFIVAKAQPYGNEWIDYTQTHYKIKVDKDGIYRIPFLVLNNAIQNFGLLPVSSLVLYHNGQVVPMHISSAGNFMTQGDYIEFYGKKNIGDIDSVLYSKGSLQAHPYASLFTDVSTYFLTVKVNGSNPRYAQPANNTSNPPAKEPYFMLTERQVYANRYYEGRYYSVSGEEVYKSIFDEGEGFVNNAFFGTVANTNPSQVTALNFTIPTPFVNTSGPDAVYKTVYINNSAAEQHNVTVKLNNNITLATSSNSGFKVQRVTKNIAATDLNTATIGNTITFTEGTGNSRKANAVCYNEISYPRNFNFDAKNAFIFELAGDNGTGRYIEVTNFNDEGQQPWLYDVTNGILLRSAQTPGSTHKFMLPTSAGPRTLVMLSGSSTSYNSVTQITPVAFTDYRATDILHQGNYLIIYNSALNALDNGTRWVDEYKNYRSSKYTARTYDIEQLYDQFGYGVTKSQLAIRNFVRYAVNEYTQFNHFQFFLIGKAREYNIMRGGTNAAAVQCLVPTFGFPGSDNLYASTRTSDIPTAAIGRLAASTPAHVRDYLNKVKEYEAEQDRYDEPQAIATKIWQKQLLHFSGGTDLGEQTQFRGFINKYKRIAEGPLWGTNVTMYSRQASGPIDESLSQVIRNKIEEGVSLITFFGHSATGAFDFSIDEPENYTNKGKYPIILSNGCFSGLIHDVSQGYSERFVLLPDKGAVAFMATTSLSLPAGLDAFSTNFYKALSDSTYTGTLGDCVAMALANTFRTSSNDFVKMVAYEMTLHGDPGIRLNQYAKPDYAIEPQSVSFTPSTLTPGLDSFDVNIDITNLGKAFADTSIKVTLTRTIYDASGVPIPNYYSKIVKAPYYRDTVVFRIPTKIGLDGYGLNEFMPYVDAGFDIAEMSEQNNGLTQAVTANIQQDDVIPIYPYEFAIVPKQGVTLKASTVNPFAAERDYRFQIDTTELFTSGIMQEQVVRQSGGVLHYTPNLTYRDSTVYYWRVKIDNSTTNTWHYSSFIYLKDEFPGWNQSHYYQYKKDDSLNLKLDGDRVFKFPSTTNNISVVTGWADAVGGNLPYAQLGYEYNNNDMYRFRMGTCGMRDGLTFAVIDGVTGEPLQSLNYQPAVRDDYGDAFGNYHCKGAASFQYGFDFHISGTHPSLGILWSQAIKNFIDAVPAGSFVLVYSTNRPDYTLMDGTLVAALQSIGLDSATQMQQGLMPGPFVFFAQKGSTSTYFFKRNTSFNIPLTADVTFNGTWFNGQWTSPKIGPAVEWGSMHWRWHAQENPTKDKQSVDIIGVDYNGAETVIRSTTNPNNLFTGNDTIKASDYPYLRLRWKTEDSTARTPAQLDYWRILYKKPPEAAMNPAAWFKVSDNITIGDSLRIEVGLENVTEVDMDSMLAYYRLRDANLNVYIDTNRQGILPGLQLLKLVYARYIDNANYNGLNKVVIEANPDNDQPEQYHFNNFAEINFNAAGDKINPLLDVTFDGQHIFNGDIVSAAPNILITLKDENPYLALDTEDVMQVYLKYPNDPTPRRMLVDNNKLKFYPADPNALLRNNKARMEFKPDSLLDGTYELIIRDRDRSGNNSSSNGSKFESNLFYDYKVSFEVINKAMITNVLNYPNPFTTKTRFLFTITGSEVPDYMKIQIMTIKGTIVREITKEEMGTLRIGHNMTDYAWDGRDQYGDILANGVYFYRVVTRLDDKQMDHLGQSYDKYFKKGFGKLVIVR